MITSTVADPAGSQYKTTKDRIADPPVFGQENTRDEVEDPPEFGQKVTRDETTDPPWSGKRPPGTEIWALQDLHRKLKIGFPRPRTARGGDPGPSGPEHEPWNKGPPVLDEGPPGQGQESRNEGLVPGANSQPSKPEWEAMESSLTQLSDHQTILLSSQGLVLLHSEEI